MSCDSLITFLKLLHTVRSNLPLSFHLPREARRKCGFKQNSKKIVIKFYLRRKRNQEFCEAPKKSKRKESIYFYTAIFFG
jgi:hypothetical protein